MFRFPRRRFLQGSGALVALPFLESLAPQARAGSEVRPPLRMGIVSVTGGTVLESWKPEQAGRLEKLPSILRPLDALKDHMLVLSGLSQSGRSKGVNAHEHCAFLHLTCADEVGKENGRVITTESVDQVAARALEKQSLLPSLEMGYVNGETRYSFREGGVPVPYERDPRLVFERMFRGRTPVAPNWERRLAQRGETAGGGTASGENASYERRVVDLILDEARGVRKSLGGGDRHKLDEFVESISEIEERIVRSERRLATEMRDLEDPGPAPLNLPQNIWQAEESRRLIHQIGRDPEVHGEYIRLMCDLFVLAFQTDTTRVITMALGSDGAMFPGVVTVGYEHHAHTLEHQGNARRVEDADPIAREGCRQIHAWYTSLFAEMASKMATIDEGGSSLLDNSMLLYTSYMADGGHGRRDYPVLLMGGAGGTLRTGRHIAYQENTPVANLYVEMLDRIGVTTGSFGNSHTSPNAAYDGRLPDLV